MKTLQYEETVAFKKGFKKLSKKFKTLSEDFEVAKRHAIELMHINKLDNGGIVMIPGYCHDRLSFYKLRKFACKSLKGKGAMSGLRVVYALDAQSLSVTFLEIYYKAAQANNNHERIKTFMKNLL